MKMIAEMTDAHLRTQIKRVLDLLRVANPVAVQELEMLQAVLTARASAEDRPYASVRSGRTAVRMLWAELGNPTLSKEQIFSELEKRGYPMSYATRGLVNDAINTMIETGEMIKVNDLRGKAAIVTGRTEKK